MARGGSEKPQRLSGEGCLFPFLQRLRVDGLESESSEPEQSRGRRPRDCSLCCEDPNMSVSGPGLPVQQSS